MNTKPGILIVDDVAANVTVLKCMLRKYKYTIYATQKSAEALDIVFTQNVDLVLLDLQMPEIDAFEIVKRIRSNEQTKSIPIIMVSLEYLKEEAQKAIDLGANDHLIKPIKEAQLIEMVKKYVK